jgi:PPIC-type PPIASE domain
MRKSWLMCALLGAMAWGQAAPATPPSASPAQAPSAAPAQPPAPPSDPGSSLPSGTPVLTITIHPPCSTAAKRAAQKPAAAKSGTTTAAAAPPAAAAKPADCKVVYSKAEFEKMGNALVAPGSTINPQQKRQLASQLPGMIAMSQEAQAQGLDKSPHFLETMKLLRMQTLARELQRNVQEEAAKVSDEKVEQYYKDNPEAFQEFNLQRLFIPRFKQENEPKEEEKTEDKADNPTPEQIKAKQEAQKAKQAAGEQELTKLADTLRERAAQGEDFAKLQKEAYDAAGMKVETPNVTMAKVRRTGLPPAQAAVFDLKPKEVSQVISDAGGHYVYKIDSTDELPFEQVEKEIHNTLQNQNQRDALEKLQNSYKFESNEAYFGGPLNQPSQRPLPNRVPPRMAPAGPVPMPHSENAPPAQTQPPAQTPPPAAEQPVPKPN